MGEVKDLRHNLSPTSYRLTFFCFHVNSPSYCYDKAFFKIWPSKYKVKVIAHSHTRYNILSTHIHFVPCWSALQYLRCSYLNDWPWKSSMSWAKSKFKVTTWVHHSVDSHPFGSMSNGPPIPEIQHFQSLTLKIQGQGHSSRSQRRYTTLSIHILFVPCQSALPFLDTAILKFDIENSRSRSWVRSNFTVTTWVQHSVDSLPFRPMWIGHTIPELRPFQNLTLKIKGQGHGWGHSSKSQSGSNILSAHIPFIPCQTGIPFLSYDFFENLTLKINGQGHG